MLIRGSKMGEALNVGSKVEVRYSKSRHSTGVIAKINNDETLAVDFDDGEREEGISRLIIHKISDDTNNELEKETCPSSEQEKLGVSTGKISERHLPGAPDKAGVPPEICIRDGSDLDDKSYQIGDKVDAKYRGRGRRYYKGTIVGIQPNGLYNVNYDDGDKDLGLSVEFIRRQPLKERAEDRKKIKLVEAGEEQQTEDRQKIGLVDDVSKTVSDADMRSVFEVGQKVEAKYRNRGRRYYKGTIVGVIPNGLYNLKYDDGDRDTNLPASAIRTVQDWNMPKVGDTKSPQRPANVRFKASEDGHALSTEETEPFESTEGMASSEVSEGRCGGFERGQIVESRHKGQGRRWYKGTVTECLSNDKYNVQYADGDDAFELPAKNIRALDAPPNGEFNISPSSRVAEDSKAGTSKLQKCSDDGNERSMESGQVESIGANILVYKAGEAEGSKNIASGFNKGDRVEAKFRGRGSRWYKGTVAACISNGTYTVLYDDGDKDPGLSANDLRAITQGPSARKPERPSDVDKPKLVWSNQQSVCANISAADGDVSFVAQEVVAEKLIHAPGKSVGIIMEEDSSLAENDKHGEVESTPRQHHSSTAYSGKGNKLYRGVVSKVNVVYLYEIKYEDGTNDVNIPFGALRTQDGVAASDIRVNSSVDVLSWQDRFWNSNK